MVYKWLGDVDEIGEERNQKKSGLRLSGNPVWNFSYGESENKKWVKIGEKLRR